MDVWRAFGLIALAVGAAILLRTVGIATAALHRRRSLRKLHFCPDCGLLLGDRQTCLHCHPECPQALVAGKGQAPPN